MLWHGKNFRGIINKAKEMIFNNTGTDLISTNAEDAIKEVNSKLTVKTTTMTISTGSEGDALLFANEYKEVIGMTQASGYWFIIPYFDRGSTYAKVLSFAPTSTAYVTNASREVTIYYRDIN